MSLALLGFVAAAPGAATVSAAAAPSFGTWLTVANNGDTLPGSTAVFNSYNQPAVNTAGLVTFRARSKSAAGGEPLRGVFSRNPLNGASSVVTVADTATLVPQPNNLAGDFTEFPSSPRIGRSSDTIATRGQSVPVWLYTLPDLTETRVGTSGVYAVIAGALKTGASLLGAVPGFEYFAVPGASVGTRFSQFPGSPAVDGTTVAFKGNYTDATTLVANTGVYFRDLTNSTGPVKLIANSQTLVPGQAPDGTTNFGSTSPPSIANGKMVFLGLDIEAAPTMGGIYLAPLTDSPTLTPLVSIGDPVPGLTPADTFNSLGEALSFDGRYVGFWGAWGTDRTNITLNCPADGNKDLLDYCNGAYPGGFATSFPVHQGMFVYDTVTHTTHTVAVTDATYATFQYFGYSGKPPAGAGSADGDQELPRWRVSSFVAVTGTSNGYQAAFKGSLAAGGSGIFLANGPAANPIVTVVDTTFPGTTVDPEAPADTVVSSVGIERDGLRGNYLAVAVSMTNADASASWAGVYLVVLHPAYVPVVPARLLETRTTPPGGGTVDGLSNNLGLRASGSITELQITGRAGVPADAAAVQINVTAVDALGAGYVTVFPCGVARPTASTVNYATGATVANGTIAQIGAGGKVCLYTHVATHLLVDISGYFPAGQYVPVTPARLLETRTTPPGSGTIDGVSNNLGMRAAGSVTTLQITGRAGVPADAAAVELNVTVVGALGQGYTAVYPCGSPRPNVSNANYAAGAIVANSTIAQIGTGGTVCVYTHQAAHLIVDVSGYFMAGSSYQAGTPARLMETRTSPPGGGTADGVSNNLGLRAAGSVTELQITGRAGVPFDALAVQVNVTAVGPLGAGFVAVYPCGSPRPNVSNVNYTSGTIVANSTIAQIGTGGKVCVYTHKAAHLLVDVSGYFPPGH